MLFYTIDEIKIRGGEKMKRLYEKISNGYKADGSDKRNVAYVSLYKNKEDIINQFGSTELFEEKFTTNIQKSIKVNNLIYPVITFDKENTVSRYLFEADVTEIFILNEAKAYFSTK